MGLKSHHKLYFRVVIISIILVVIAGGWLAREVARKKLRTYFHQKISPSPNTHISYDVEGLAIEWFQKSIALQNAQLNIVTDKPGADTSTYQVIIPAIHIHIASILKMFLQNTLEVREISIEDPLVNIILPPNQDSIILQKEVGDIQQNTMRFLKNLDLQQFKISHGAIQIREKDSTAPKYALQDVNVNIDNLNVNVDSLSTGNVSDVMLADQIEVILNNESILLPDQEHIVRFKQLRISSSQSDIYIDSLHLFPVSHIADSLALTANDSIKIPKLHLKGVDFLSLYLNNQLFIDTVLISNTKLNVSIDDNSIYMLQPMANQKNHGLDSIHISSVQMMPSMISMRSTTDTSDESFQVDSAMLNLENVTHSAKADSAFSWNVDNLHLQLRNYQSKLADKHYNFSFDKLNWSLKEKTFGLEGVSIEPIPDSVGTAPSPPIRYIKIPSFAIREIDFSDLIFHKQLTGGSIVINEPSIGLNAKQQADSTENSSVNVADILQQFFSTFRLGALQLKNGDLAFFRNQEKPFLMMEGIGLFGNDWELTEDIEFIQDFPFEAFFEKGNLDLPDYSITLLNTRYDNASDNLVAQQINIDPVLSEGLQAQIQLQDIGLQGVNSMPSSNHFGFLSIGKAKAKIILPEAPSSKKVNNTAAPSLFKLTQLNIGNLDAVIEKPGAGVFVLENMRAKLNSVQLGASEIPFLFDVPNSELAIGATSFQLTTLEGKMDSLRLYHGNTSLFNLTALTDTTADAQWQLILPILEANGLRFPNENSSEWHLTQLALRKPVVKGRMPQAKQDSTAVKNSKSTTSSSFRLHIDSLLVDEADWLLEQFALNDTTILNSDGLTLRGYDLQYPLADNALLNQRLYLDVNNFRHASRNTHLEIETANISMKEQTVDVQNLTLKTSTKTAKIPDLKVDARLAEMQLTTENADGWNLEQPWIIKDLLLKQPDIFVTWDSVLETASEAAKMKQAPKLSMPSLALQNFTLENAKIETDGPDDQPTFHINGLDVHLADLNWNTSETLDAMALLQDGDWRVNIDHPQVKFPDPPAEANLYGLAMQKETAHIIWDSLQWAPTVDPVAYSDYLTHQKSWLSIQTGAGTVENLEWEAATNGHFRASKILIKKPQLRVFRDKRLPFPENHHPPMLHKNLRNLERLICIDTLELNNGNIDVRIQPESGDKIGHLTLSGLETIMTNVTNMSSEVKEDDIMRVEAFTTIQNTGQIRAKFAFDLDDPHYTFSMDVKAGKMNLEKLNSFTVPVASVRVRSGNMRNLELKAIANDYFAYGNMDFMYRKLHLSILNKKDRDRQGLGTAIESFLANTLILRRNNDHPFPHRQGQVFVERNTEKSIFNYWGNIAISGILTSAGVKSNRNALKKQFDHQKKLLEEDMEDDNQVFSNHE